jgi:hypothetical protein
VYFDPVSSGDFVNPKKRLLEDRLSGEDSRVQGAPVRARSHLFGEGI